MPANRKHKPELMHMAAFIRAELANNGWTMADLNAKLGMSRGSTIAYPWIHASVAPSEDNVTKLLTLFPHAPAGTFLPKEPVTMATYDEPSNNIVPMRSVRNSGNPLQFSVSPDGTARLQLDVSGPIESMSALLRMLLDQNVLSK